MKKITLLLADDHQIVREGFRVLLQDERDMEIVGEAETGRQAVQLAEQLQPAVVVMDIAMPQLNGLEATRQILEARPATRVIILSSHHEASYVEEAIAAGATAYLIKQFSCRALSETIRAVQQPGRFLCPHLKTQAAKFAAQNVAGRPRRADLTAREAEVLQLVAEGHANKQCAAELGISIKTVEKHREHLMEKLDIHHTAGLTRYAISAGVIERSRPLKDPDR